MSFSSEVRLEVARTPCERACDARAELCAAVLVGSGLSYRGPGRYGVTISSESRELIERDMALMHRFLGVNSEMKALHTDRLGGQTFFQTSPAAASEAALLSELALLDPSAPFGMRTAPDPALIQKDCCRRAFLRGAMLSGGMVSDPEKAYHLEIASGASELSERVAGLMRDFELPARVTRRKGRWLAYLKDADQIADVLRLIGAYRALMQLENVRIMKGVRNDVNRQVNCDQNNLDKTVAAAEKQLSIIRTIDRLLGLDALPDGLREIARLRMDHPDASLAELGALASSELGKSGVNARMRKLEAIAEELVNQ